KRTPPARARRSPAQGRRPARSAATGIAGRYARFATPGAFRLAGAPPLKDARTVGSERRAEERGGGAEAEKERLPFEPAHQSDGGSPTAAYAALMIVEAIVPKAREKSPGAHFGALGDGSLRRSVSASENCQGPLAGTVAGAKFGSRRAPGFA